MFKFEDIAPVPEFPTGEPGFIAQLRSFDPRKPHWQEMAVIPPETLDLRGAWRIVPEFPDPDGVLESAYAALKRFYDAHVPKLDRTVTIAIRADRDLTAEAYSVAVVPDGITLLAADTEGMRRAVYALIDMMRGEDIPALPYRKITKKPWLKNRISRCFFGPIKRPPFFRDELTDEVDYYPEPYLDRLAAEGINGLWLTVVWNEVALTSFFPSDPLREKRLAKLRRTVEKCRKYGIRIWIFCIEPASWHPDHPLPPGRESMRGEPVSGEYQAFCAASPESRQYIRECAASIFREIPGLGGMMLISLGERPTSCLSYVYSSESGENPCRTRCGLSNSQILNEVLSAIKAGIRDAGSDAEVLSWLYNPRAQQIPDWWFELPESLDRDSILAFNFESGCTKAQTGRVHAGGDYWLSCVGPSDRFGRMGAAARGRCEFAAKLQVGCSHELATVPFVPVPGMLYRKYRTMRRLGVRHVIQCWYFGNYPGTMNQAAGMLAFEEFADSEDDFLTRLARPDWGAAEAPRIAAMWRDFGRAYENYPLDIQFQYYGPMHDGVVWPLHLRQMMRPLSRSWKPDAFPAGDAVGEALVNHTLADAELLAGQLADGWRRAAKDIPELRRIYAEDSARLRDCDLYEALELLLDSGADILSFYHLRQRLLTGDASVIPELRRIAEKECAASRRMIDLCEADPRLGYHSEAEVFKFFPAKLRWRIAELERLKRELDELNGRTPEEIRELLAWRGTEFAPGETYAARTFRWTAEVTGRNIEFTLRFQELPEPFSDEQRYLMLMARSGDRFPAVLNFDRESVREAYCDATQGIKLTREDGDVCHITVPRGKFDYAAELFVGVQRTWRDADRRLHSDNTPDGEYDPDPRLNFNGYSAERLGLLKW